MADALRDGQIDASWVGMEFLRYRPPSLAFREMPWRRHGDIFSFHFADVGRPAVRVPTFCSARVTNLYHVASVPRRPGLGVFFNQWKGVHNLVIAWATGVIVDEEVARLSEIVREEMGWHATA
jgi:hypothetical protein